MINTKSNDRDCRCVEITGWGRLQELQEFNGGRWMIWGEDDLREELGMERCTMGGLGNTRKKHGRRPPTEEGRRLTRRENEENKTALQGGLTTSGRSARRQRFQTRISTRDERH